MNKPFESVATFNKDILGIAPRKIGLQTSDEFLLTMTQFQEEINEITDAYADNDLVGVIDGCIDLEYFLLGMLYKLGLDSIDYETIFHIIHTSNMQKMAGKKKSRPGFNSVDAVKPIAWEAPETHISRYLTLAISEQEKENSIG